MYRISHTVTHTEAQLLPTHIVTVRYMAENPHTDAHYARVGIYNPALWNLIRPAPQGIPAPPQPQLPPPPQNQASQHFWAAQAKAKAAQTWTDAEHCYHTVGNTVEITGVHHKKYTPFLNCQGVIRRTVARGSDFKFFVHVQRNARGEPVDCGAQIADLNRRSLDFLRPDERGLLPCKTTHIRRLGHLEPPSPSQESQGGKRPRLGGSDGATGM